LVRPVVGLCPIVVGVICSVIALELGLARGELGKAVRFSITVGTCVALANLVVLLAVLDYLKV
jgi:hypothetical protein